MVTSIQALNAIFSYGKKVKVSLKKAAPTIFYCSDGTLRSSNPELGDFKRFDIDLEILYNHFEAMLREGGTIEIL